MSEGLKLYTRISQACESLETLREVMNERLKLEDIDMTCLRICLTSDDGDLCIVMVSPDDSRSLFTLRLTDQEDDLTTAGDLTDLLIASMKSGQWFSRETGVEGVNQIPNPDVGS